MGRKKETPGQPVKDIMIKSEGKAVKWRVHTPAKPTPPPTQLRRDSDPV